MYQRTFLGTSISRLNPRARSCLRTKHRRHSFPIDRLPTKQNLPIHSPSFPLPFFFFSGLLSSPGRQASSSFIPDFPAFFLCASRLSLSCVDTGESSHSLPHSPASICLSAGQASILSPPDILLLIFLFPPLSSLTPTIPVPSSLDQAPSLLSVRLFVVPRRFTMAPRLRAKPATHARMQRTATQFSELEVTPSRHEDIAKVVETTIESEESFLPQRCTDN